MQNGRISAVGGDDVDDDPDDARRDGDDDGIDFPLREGAWQISPCRSSSSFCLVSASQRRRNISLRSAPTFLGQRQLIHWRGAGGGPQRPGAGPSRGQRWARGLGSPLHLVARLRAPFWLCDLFPKILSSEFFWNFWSFRRQVSWQVLFQLISDSGKWIPNNYKNAK